MLFMARFSKSSVKLYGSISESIAAKSQDALSPLFSLPFFFRLLPSSSASETSSVFFLPPFPDTGESNIAAAKLESPKNTYIAALLTFASLLRHSACIIEFTVKSSVQSLRLYRAHTREATALSSNSLVLLELLMIFIKKSWTRFFCSAGATCSATDTLLVFFFLPPTELVRAEISDNKRPCINARSSLSSIANNLNSSPKTLPKLNASRRRSARIDATKTFLAHA